MTIDQYNPSLAQKEFEEHGETWLQERFSGKFNTIFDVGCNIGEWTKMARKYQPQADIHMFEVMPETYRSMLSNVQTDENMHTNGFGLSNYSGTLEMKYKPSYSAVSTSVMDLRLDDSFIRHGLVMKGDDYVKSRNIKSIDYLKIDTEGAEDQVFKGFENTLKEGKIKVIQFEYGYICILTKWLLIDSYKYLTPLGFTLGRLKKGSIVFKEYALPDEDFNGPDFIAVHESVKHNFGL